MRLTYQTALLLASWSLCSVAWAAPAIDTAETALAQGEYERAEVAFQKLRRGKWPARAALGLARVQYATGRYDEAARTAARAGRAKPVRVAALTVRGEAQLARGQLAAAERTLSAIASEPGAHRARLRLGQLHLRRGEKSRAEPYFMALIQAYNDRSIGEDDAAGIAYVAEAAWMLEAWHDANDAFRQAALADRGRVETQLAWASLFLAKYDVGHAEESVVEALEHNPHDARAHALMARIKLQQGFDFPAADEALDKAFEVNPNLVMAHVTKAGMALRNMDIEGADRHLDRALSVDPRDLEALSVRAAVRFLADDEAGLDKAEAKVLQLNPRFSRMYSIIARYAEWEHRYEELVKFARRALAIDSEDPLAYATLGINLLRMGEEQRGLEALKEAWKRDRFNVHVLNTLNLYEEVIADEYEKFDAGRFLIRLHKDERASLEPYLVPMLERAYAEMRRRYGFKPEGPLHIELYADREHFSVRTTGLPRAGVQGVCFGKVVTALSPRGGPFNWGQITWHEVAHIFHLQMSKNHVPRWFTEGLAEYETIVARPEWRREDDHRLWMALLSENLPHLADLNTAFTQAETPEQLMTAYYAASQVVVYIVERFGFDKVPGMLQAWGAGKRTARVVQDELGVGIDQLDADFRAHTKKRLAERADHFYVDFGKLGEVAELERQAKAHPDDADAHADLALARLREGDVDAAAPPAKRAIALSPHHPRAHFAMARVALKHGRVKVAERCLRAIVRAGEDSYELRFMLAQARLMAKDFAAALQELRAAARLDPDRVELWQVMVEIGAKKEDQALLMRALERVVALDQHDGDAHMALLLKLALAERWRDVVQVGEKTLFLEPDNPELHRVLARGYLRTGRAHDALREAAQALSVEHPEPGEVQLLRARILTRLGRKAEARKAAKRAVAADPRLASDAKEFL